jgi:ADP-heptose:LPS heptosyltransferase
VSWWGGSLVHQMKRRSIPFESFQRLFSVDHVDFVNLQHGSCDETAARGELAGFQNLTTYTSINPYMDLDSWIDLIAQLELVISVDNSNAHFAGALGVETWLLLPEHPNWRWPYDITHSQWYERVELVRNESSSGDSPPEGWSNLISKIIKKLEEKVKTAPFQHD